MFCDNLQLNAPAEPAPLPSLSPTTFSTGNFLDDIYGKRKKKGGGKRRGKGHRDKGRKELEELLCGLTYRLGFAHAENQFLRNMMELSVAASRRTLREDVIEAGFQILDHGEH